MDSRIQSWQRVLFNDRAVYLDPDGPDWMVPNREGDALMQEVIKTPSRFLNDGQGPLDTSSRRFLSELDSTAKPAVYTGRSNHLNLETLKECWFHITDQCNLTCRHCMFSCSPKTRTTMPWHRFSALFEEAFTLGCRTIFLTGGEPLLHRDFEKICTRILSASRDTRLVILTNGLLIKKKAPFLRSLPQDRLHLQVSVDGTREQHDRIRGQGSFDGMIQSVSQLSGTAGQLSFAMAVTPENLDQMGSIVALAAENRIANVHYLWMFSRGNAAGNPIPDTDRIFAALQDAATIADQEGVVIDNLSAMEKQVFSPQGTRHDLGTAGWESIAIAPDESVYPTPALIGLSSALCGHASQGVERIWLNSEVLEEIRNLTIAQDPSRAEDPLKYIVGGGDIDHSVHHGGAFKGCDPYLPLYRKIALYLMVKRVRPDGEKVGSPAVLLRMGDRLMSCDDAHGAVALTHSNCVLSLSTVNAGVQHFYGEAADTPNADISNPVCYPEAEISHVPQSARVRAYGCGSPVLDAGILEGHAVVDLGSGAGMECFIAARKVGPSGEVFGIDMTDSMLAQAEDGLKMVENSLGYKNVAFKKSFLENIPIAESAMDIVISNCVINLSGDKHQTFGEIFRILKPGGKLVISDIVTDQVPDPAILNDPLLRGECIAGALVTTRLMAILEITGFERIRMVKRFFYREVQGHLFFSITYEAWKPATVENSRRKRDVLYPGPFAAVITDSGQTLVRGERRWVYWPETDDDALFLLDDRGNVTNIEMENSCACFHPPEASAPADEPSSRGQESSGTDEKSMVDCMMCGSPLHYFTENRPMVCAQCGQEKPANAMCRNGHFICDACHSKDALAVVADLCLNSRETDMICLVNQIRKHPMMPLHGPEHHFIVPGAIVAAYRNLGGDASDNQIRSAIERGKAVPGGSCGFWGGCGAALGVGIGFGIILESNPIKAEPRQAVQQLTGRIIQTLSRVKASRCCQRESWTALTVASKMSETLLPIAMPVIEDLVCTQAGQNRECPKKACPYFKPATMSTPVNTASLVSFDKE
ncbi:MAG TPA: DUF5714 domain-containing protein [Desulfobacteraceae bacterium]|nr:DUF5714 domain-containing protein [Desulfobacteraceae bacterium]